MVEQRNSPNSKWLLALQRVIVLPWGKGSCRRGSWTRQRSTARWTWWRLKLVHNHSAGSGLDVQFCYCRLKLEICSKSEIDFGARQSMWNARLFWFGFIIHLGRICMLYLFWKLFKEFRHDYTWAVTPIHRVSLTHTVTHTHIHSCGSSARGSNHLSLPPISLPFPWPHTEFSKSL